MQPKYTDNNIKLIQDELTRSIDKHGNWSNYSPWRMLWVCLLELWEVFKAIWRHDLYGKHGVYAEFSQVAAVALKAMDVLEHRRSKECNHANI